MNPFLGLERLVLYLGHSEVIVALNLQHFRHRAFAACLCDRANGDCYRSIGMASSFLGLLHGEKVRIADND
jgi:hypothetical protein